MIKKLFCALLALLLLAGCAGTGDLSRVKDGIYASGVNCDFAI